MRNIAIGCGLVFALLGCQQAPKPHKVPGKAEIAKALSPEALDALGGYDRCLTEKMDDGAIGKDAAEDCASAIRYAEIAVQDDLWAAYPDLTGKESQRLARSTVKSRIKSKIKPPKQD